jgi:hypothetical protein
MAGLALDVRSIVLGAHTPRTVPQQTPARNAVVSSTLITACVINGDMVTAALNQATWLTLAVTLLIFVRIVGGVALNLGGKGRRSGGEGSCGKQEH